MIDDLVDLVCEDDCLRKKIIFTSNKNSKKLRSIIRLFVFYRHDARIDGRYAQARNKLKALVSICKKASLTRKSASEIEDFILNRGMINGFPSFSRISRVKNPHSQNSVSFLLFSKIFPLNLKELNNVSFALLKVDAIVYN